MSERPAEVVETLEEAWAILSDVCTRVQDGRAYRYGVEYEIPQWMRYALEQASLREVRCFLGDQSAFLAQPRG